MALPKRPSIGNRQEVSAVPQQEAVRNVPAQPQPQQQQRQPVQPPKPDYSDLLDLDELPVVNTKSIKVPEVNNSYDNGYVEPSVVESTPEPQYVAPEPVHEPVRAPVNAVEPVVEEVHNEEPEAMEIDDDTAEQYDAFAEQDFVAAGMLLALLNSDDSSEVLMNDPKTILYKQHGQRIHAKDIVFSSTEAYHQFIDEVILDYTDTADRIHRKDGKGNNEVYLIEGQLNLPNFEDESAPALLARVHIIAPPVVQNSIVTIAKKSRYQLTLKDIMASGSMSPQMADFLKAITRGRATMVFSGLSGSGKTTLLEALSYEFDPNDRVIVVEDTPELRLPVTDVIYLNSTSSKPGMDVSKAVPLEWLVAAANRMRPTRVIVGEVRGAEMGEFLIAANSGADGSMTTMHASTPQLTLDKMVSLSLKGTSSKSENSVARDIASTVQIIVQMSLIDGQHVVTQIQEVTRAIRKETGGIVTQTLFEYDKDKGVFRPVQRPTAELTSFLNQRGVDLEMNLFRGMQ